MARVDLNAKRAARSEAQNKPHELALGFDASGAELVWLLKPRMPLEFAELLSQGRTGTAMKLLLVNPDDWERMREFVPEDDDLYDIGRLYDVDLGESSASSASLASGGPSSRLTSDGSTASASVVPVGVPMPSVSGNSTASSAG